MPVMPLGLAMTLDAMGAAPGLGTAAQCGRIGAGVAFTLTAAATFGLALVLNQHESGTLHGRLRSFTTMAGVGAMARPRSSGRAAGTCRWRRPAGGAWLH